MGLDMYLEGRKYLRNSHDPEKALMEDGYPIKETVLDIGYWRKHPDLHGYIVETFADGDDNCEPVELSSDDLVNILNAIKTDQLVKTSGFFFGNSPTVDEGERYTAIKSRSIAIITNALDWLNREDSDSYKYVVYRASW